MDRLAENVENGVCMASRSVFWLVCVLINVIGYNAFAENVPGVTSTEIRLGNDSDQSGFFSGFGILQRAMKAYFDMINKKGGIYGRKIVFEIGDSASNAQHALQVIKKQVVEDQVLAVVGGGVQHASVYRYLREQGVPDLWVAHSNSAYTTPTYPTTFGFSPTSAEEGKFYADFMAKHWPGKTVGILCVNNNIGNQGNEAFIRELKGRLKVVVEVVDSSAGEAKAQVMNLKNAKADIVYLAIPGPIAAASLRFAHEQDFHPQWMLPFYDSYRATLDLAGKSAVEGAIGWYYTFTDSEVDEPAVRKHIEFMKAYLPNDKPSAGTLGGQALAELTVETLRRAGKNLTRESLLKAAESFRDWKCSVCRSSNSTGPDKHLFNTHIELLKVHDGHWIPYRD